MKETWVGSLGRKDLLEKGMATIQYSCLGNPINRGAWQRSQRVRHSWVTNTFNVILAFVFVMTFCFERGMQDSFPFCKVCVGSEVDTHEKWLWRWGSGLGALNLFAFNSFHEIFRSLSTFPQKKFFFVFNHCSPLARHKLRLMLLKRSWFSLLTVKFGFWWRSCGCTAWTLLSLALLVIVRVQPHEACVCPVSLLEMHKTEGCSGMHNCLQFVRIKDD